MLAGSFVLVPTGNGSTVKRASTFSATAPDTKKIGRYSYIKRARAKSSISEIEEEQITLLRKNEPSEVFPDPLRVVL